MIIPEFGFIAASETREVGSAPPERRWHGASYVETPGDDIGFHHWSGLAGLKITARAGVRAWLAVISDGAGDGFQMCEWCGWASAIRTWQPHQETPEARDRQGLRRTTGDRGAGPSLSV